MCVCHVVVVVGWRVGVGEERVKRAAQREQFKTCMHDRRWRLLVVVGLSSRTAADTACAANKYVLIPFTWWRAGFQGVCLDVFLR